MGEFDLPIWLVLTASMADMQGSLKARALSKITGAEQDAAIAKVYGRISVPPEDQLWIDIMNFSGLQVVQALMESRRLQQGESSHPIIPARGLGTSKGTTI